MDELPIATDSKDIFSDTAVPPVNLPNELVQRDSRLMTRLEVGI